MNTDDNIRDLDLGDNAGRCEFCASKPCICEDGGDTEENPMSKLYEVYIEPTDDAQGVETVFVRMDEDELAEMTTILNDSKKDGTIEHFDVVALEGKLIRSFDEAVDELADLSLIAEPEEE